MTILQRLQLLFVYALGVPLIRILDVLGLIPPLIRIINRTPRRRAFLKSFGTYQARQSDVFICAYPKSGTNWMMQVAYQIAHRGSGNFDHVHDVIPWPDALTPVSAQLDDESLASASPTNLRVIKTHLDWQYIPYSADAHYICVVRDPKDVLVSSYHFVRDVALGPMMPSLDSWHKTFLTSDSFFLGSWAENVNSYWQVRECDNVFFVTFEEMIADQANVIQQIARFIGVDLTPQELNLVNEKSHFQYMKAHADQFDPQRIFPWTSQHARMIRSGKSGASSELLTRTRQQQIDHFCRAELQRLGSDLPYDELFEIV